MRQLSEKEADLVRGGELITLTLVLTYLAIALVTVAVWKLFEAKKGKLTFPGGFLFEWSAIKFF
ncbi:MAG: hypothetical protein LBM99_05335 [Bacillales bacterium]|jgi:hypothetical protein|nr:hypothetical protein [Bacillales bacterium]